MLAIHAVGDGFHAANLNGALTKSNRAGAADGTPGAPGGWLVAVGFLPGARGALQHVDPGSPLPKAAEERRHDAREFAARRHEGRADVQEKVRFRLSGYPRKVEQVAADGFVAEA